MTRDNGRDEDGSAETQHGKQHPNKGKVFGKPFQPGQSGNPRGRLPNTVFVTTLARDRLSEVPDKLLDGKPNTGKRTWAWLIADKLVQDAAAGDSRARAELLERIEGKPTVFAEAQRPLIYEITVQTEASKRIVERIIAGEGT